MAEEKDEGHPLLDNQYSSQDNKTFQAIDHSIEEESSQFFPYEEGKIKDYGTGRNISRVDEKEAELEPEANNQNREVYSEMVI